MRLQRKVMDLEKKLSEVQKEVAEGGGATRKSRLATDWIPRPPERYELFSILLNSEFRFQFCFQIRVVWSQSSNNKSFISSCVLVSLNSVIIKAFEDKL